MGSAEDDAAAAGIDPKGRDLTRLDEPVPVPRPERSQESITIDELRAWAEAWQSAHPGFGPDNYVDAFRNANGELVESEEFVQADARFELLAHLNASDEHPDKPPMRSSYGKLAHVADTVGEWDIAAVRADLTEAADRSLDDSALLGREDLRQSLAEMARGEGTSVRPGSRGVLKHLAHQAHPLDEAPVDQLPPGPWTWQRTEHHGESLLGADGTVVLSSEGGHGWQEFASPEVKELLAQAWRLAPIPTEPAGQHQPEDEPQDCAVAALYELAGAKMTGKERQVTLDHGLRAVAELTRDRDDALEQLRIARNLAWSYEHRMFAYKEIGVELDADGGMILPPWVISPASPNETLHELDDDGFIWGTFTTGECVWVTDGTEPMYARVSNALDDRAKVKVLTSAADSVAPQEPSS